MYYLAAEKNAFSPKRSCHTDGRTFVIIELVRYTKKHIVYKKSVIELVSNQDTLLGYTNILGFDNLYFSFKISCLKILGLFIKKIIQ